MFFNVDFNTFQELYISKKVATHTQPKQQIYFTEGGIYIAILIICNNMIYESERMIIAVNFPI